MDDSCLDDNTIQFNIAGNEVLSIQYFPQKILVSKDILEKQNIKTDDLILATNNFSNEQLY